MSLTTTSVAVATVASDDMTEWINSPNARISRWRYDYRIYWDQPHANAHHTMPSGCERIKKEGEEEKKIENISQTWFALHSAPHQFYILAIPSFSSRQFFRRYECTQYEDDAWTSDVHPIPSKRKMHFRLTATVICDAHVRLWMPAFQEKSKHRRIKLKRVVEVHSILTEFSIFFIHTFALENIVKKIIRDTRFGTFPIKLVLLAHTKYYTLLKINVTMTTTLHSRDSLQVVQRNECLSSDEICRHQFIFTTQLRYTRARVRRYYIILFTILYFLFFDERKRACSSARIA